MSSIWLAIPVPRNVSCPIPGLSYYYVSHVFLLPTVFSDSRKWSSPLILPYPRKRFLHRFPSLPPSTSPSFSCNEEEEEEEIAREAVRQYLEQEVGVSVDESFQISSNCPKYIAMLIHSVQDLDQLSSSSLPFWSSSAPLSFMDKIHRMAKQKGDKGMLPYLESIGLTLSSASHLARYLSSHTLSTLIQQVKYVKEIFFSDSDDLGLTAQHARTMMMNLSISVDGDMQQTLSFFEKIQARRGGLNLLGTRDASFPQLIESFPGLLQLPIESRMKLMVEFFHCIGVPKGCLGKLFLLFPPLLCYDIEKEVKPRLLALRKVGAEYADLGMLLVKYPWILSTCIHENCEKVLAFFDKEKVPQDSVMNAIKYWPILLGCSVSKLKLMVEHFSELHVTNKKLSRIIARSPRLLLQKPEEFLEVVLYFKELGLDEASVGRILARRPEIFAGSIEGTFKRKLDLLSNIGVSRNHLPRVIKKYPDFFVCDVDCALRPRMMYLMEIGLSKKDVGFMVRRFSPLLGYSIENVLRPKIEFLVDVMEKPLSDLVDYPRYFSYSLEKKIKPRFWVLKGRNLECSLEEMLNKNDEEFAAEFMGVGRRLE